jgi:hypothetical protein
MKTWFAGRVGAMPESLFRRLVRQGLFAVVLFAGAATDVQAGCRQVCTRDESCDQLSGDERWRCIRGTPTQSCQTVCSDQHGAIAYSRGSGAYGYAYDHDSETRAKRVALGQCARRAPDCQIVLTFIDQCGAIAETPKWEVSAGLGKTRKEAEERSLAACRAAGGKGCSVAAWTCSGV